MFPLTEYNEIPLLSLLSTTKEYSLVQPTKEPTNWPQSLVQPRLEPSLPSYYNNNNWIVSSYSIVLINYELTKEFELTFPFLQFQYYCE